MKKRLHVIFEGAVIGIGFRFATLQIAKQYKSITGWIRNTPQSDVELVAEGREE